MSIKNVVIAIIAAGVSSASLAADMVDLQQTPFLKSQPAGDSNLVRLLIRNDDTTASARLSVAIPDMDPVSTETQIVTGEAAVELMLPTVTNPTTVTVTLAAQDAPVVKRDFLLKPVKQWKIFAVPSTHVDIGYTDNRKAIMDLHNDSLDAAMALTKNNDAINWNVEVAWQVKNYLRDRPETSDTALLETMREGSMGLHAGYLNMLTALMSDEAMNRYSLYAAELARNENIKTDTLILSDVPTATWAMPSMMAASGIKYFAEGCNMDRGPMLRDSGITNPFYWQGPDGGKVLAFLSMHYALAALWLAESPSIVEFEKGVVGTVAPFLRDDYPSDAVYLYGAFLDNRPFNENYGRFLDEYKSRWDYPEIIVSHSDDFFEYLEKNSGEKLETRSVDFGAYWEDGAGSTAQETIMHMENQRDVVAAETLYSLLKMAGSSTQYPAEQLDQVWDDVMFYNEHTWGSAVSISKPDSPEALQQWAEKSQFAHRPHEDLKRILADALQAYVKSIGAKKGTVVVANTLGFARDGVVRIGPGFSEVTVEDEQGNPVPAQVEDGVLHISMTDVPGFGNRKYNLITGAAERTTATGKTLENKYYRIVTEDGVGISSITDLETGRELIDTTSPYGFGQIVYALGGDGTKMIHPPAETSATFVIQPPQNGEIAADPPVAQVNVYPAKVTGVEMGGTGLLFSDVIIKSTAPSMANISTTLRLYHTEKRLGLTVDITSKTEERRKEAVYVAFPLLAVDPEYRLGMTNAISNPTKDFAVGACHEWYCVQDFVTCKGSDGAEILWSAPDAPLLTLSEINKGTWKSKPQVTTPTVFSYIMNNYWHTNYKAGQGGDFRFRYNLTSKPTAFNNDECLRFARGAANPFLAAMGSGDAAAENEGLTVIGEGVIPGTIRQATDGKGFILRLRNAGATQTTANVSRGANPASYRLVNLVEDNLEGSAKFTDEPVTLDPYQTVTLYLQ